MADSPLIFQVRSMGRGQFTDADEAETETDNPALERWYRRLLALWYLLYDASLSSRENMIVQRELNRLLEDRERRDQWIADMQAFIQERPEAIHLMLRLPAEGRRAEVRARFLN